MIVIHVNRVRSREGRHQDGQVMSARRDEGRDAGHICAGLVDAATSTDPLVLRHRIHETKGSGLPHSCGLR